MLKNLSEKIGFTQTEIKVILFLVIIFFIGFGAKYLFFQNDSRAQAVYDYSDQDSIFNSIVLDTSVNNQAAFGNNKENAYKSVDYKQEVLDFNKANFENTKKAELPEKSININTASLKEFLKLPGIGEKTAGNIIDFRKKNRNFRKLEDILKVKGIGNSKFNKIKKYLYIE
jgi:competence protein ComEA